MPTLRELLAFGQSVWIDTLSRQMMTSGDLPAYIAQGVRGVTANPTILDKAISGSADYDDDIRRMAHEGKSAEEIYEGLVLADIGHAADLLLPVYQLTGGNDGYVSLEVNAHKAFDSAATIAEVRHLFTALNRPNVMIKVPATPEGMLAIEQLTSEGININATLIFSITQYQAVAEAYLSGLERFQRAGGDMRRVNSVASFFVSRIDTEVDKRLEVLGEVTLQGRIAIANAKLAYARFRAILASERWRHLELEGAHIQRVLWASTGTKNPRYPDTMYVDHLIGGDTVNTMPLATLQAFLDHGSVTPRLAAGLDEAQFDLARLSELGIDLYSVTESLLDDGVDIFARSYDHLIAHIDEKCDRFRRGRHAA